MKEIVILHIFTDEKFFDSASNFFDSLKGVKNLYYFYADDENYSFRYIKENEKVRICTSYDKYIRLLGSSDIDIIYFQSLPEKYYKYFKYINPKTIIIWWCFGFEIYYPTRCLSPLVGGNLYKPLTLRYRGKSSKGVSLRDLIRSIYWVSRYPLDYLRRKHVLKRIDYFSPVLPIDYIQMQKIPYFRAKPFMINAGPGLVEKTEFSYFSSAQNILIGNSFTYTNNHLDIFAKIKSYHLLNQRYIVPINYGTDYNSDRNLFKSISGLSPESVIWIDDFLPFEKYKVVLSTVSHAIFGHMRQQSMGNINICFLTGVKVFLYKDSVLFKQLTDFGYIVFSIEDDLTEEALATPLSKEDAYINYTVKIKLSANKLERTEEELNRIVKIGRSL